MDDKIAAISNIKNMTGCDDKRAQQHYSCYLERKRAKSVTNSNTFIEALKRCKNGKD